MKKLFLVCLIFLTAFMVFAAQYHTVPLDSEAYRIIDSAVISGIIPMQTTVKPYNLSKVRSLLLNISTSGKISSAEQRQIFLILDDFDRLYGNEETKDKKAVIKNVFFRDTVGKGSSLTVGLKFKSIQTVGLGISNITTEGKETGKYWDSRNSMTAFAMGDILDKVSYDINLELAYDRLNPAAFLLTDFTWDGDGWYQSISNDSPTNIDGSNDKAFLGFHYEPEVSTSLADDSVSIRFASIKRDWGSGHGNFELNSSAGCIDAIECTVSPVSWASYSVLCGSLSKFSLGVADYEDGKITNENGTIMGVQVPSDLGHSDYFNNNFSTHKFELGPIAGVRLDVWESVVYRKRFELGYLNPLGIYMFAQNAYSDFDNVIAGADITVNLFNFQFYLGVGMDEIGDPKPKRILKDPRNLLSYQAGAKFSAPNLNFSVITAQVTYVPAFFGSHYGCEYTSNPAGFTGWKTTFVNKGHLISYPVNPDTLEVLMAFDGTIGDSLGLNITLKNQMRSYQYATHVTGTDVLDSMKYGDDSKYADRDFFHNIAQNTFDFEVNMSKRFYETPVKIIGSLQFIMDSNRAKEESYKDYSYSTPNYGKTSDYGDWKTTFDLNLGLGVKVNY